MDSYEDIYNRMKIRYKQLSSYDVPELSDIDIRMRVLAGEIYNDEVNLEFVKRQIFCSTATGDYLDYHAADRGLTRNGAVKSRGNVRFFVNEPLEVAILIPAQTVVSTSGDSPVRFVTDSDAVLSAGSQYTTVSCTAQNGGINGNVAAYTVDTLITNVVGIDGVENLYSFSGGTNTESDEVLRKRVLDTYKWPSNGTNKAYYKKLALSVEGVCSANVVPRARGTGTVDVYISGENTVTPISLVNEVEALIQSQRELNVDVDVSAAEILRATIGVFVDLKDGYGLDEVTQNINNNVAEYMSKLEVGEGLPQYPLSAAILSAEGVENFLFDYTYQNAFPADPEVLIVYNEVLVSEREVE